MKSTSNWLSNMILEVVVANLASEQLSLVLAEHARTAFRPLVRCFRSSVSGTTQLLPEYRLHGGSRIRILNHRINVAHQDIRPLGHVLSDQRQVTRLDKMPAES